MYKASKKPYIYARLTWAVVTEHVTSPLWALIILPKAVMTSGVKVKRPFSARISVNQNNWKICKYLIHFVLDSINATIINFNVHVFFFFFYYIGHSLPDFYNVITITVLFSESMKWLIRKLTDEVNGDGGEFCLDQEINESLLFDTALDMGVHHNTWQLRILNQALGRGKMTNPELIEALCKASRNKERNLKGNSQPHVQVPVQPYQGSSACWQQRTGQ